MIRNEKGRLKPFNLENVFKSIPDIQRLGIEIHAMELSEIIDSSNMNPTIWIELAKTIEKHYKKYDGFVVLHGSDTMAYSASALSFLLENLAKPVIFTGSQLPIGLPRTDARENLITALEIAALKKAGKTQVPEVCIYFEDKLYRGNRTHKFNSENFDAFLSVNHPILAEAGVHIKLDPDEILPFPNKPLVVHKQMSAKVATVKLFPGIDLTIYVDAWINARIQVLILETYGSGNGPTDKKFMADIKKLTGNRVHILNVTQCREGKVEMGKYETSEEMDELGVLSGADMTLEAAITKSMFVLGKTEDKNEQRELLAKPLRGEMTH